MPKEKMTTPPDIQDIAYFDILPRLQHPEVTADRIEAIDDYLRYLEAYKTAGFDAKKALNNNEPCMKVWSEIQDKSTARIAYRREIQFMLGYGTHLVATSSGSREKRYASLINGMKRARNLATSQQQ